MIDKNKLDEAYQNLSAIELAKAPIHAIRGISEHDSETMKEIFGVDTIAQLADLKYFQRAKMLKEKADQQ